LNMSNKINPWLDVLSFANIAIINKINIDITYPFGLEKLNNLNLFANKFKLLASKNVSVMYDGGCLNIKCL
jgi:hypothetical protein